MVTSINLYNKFGDPTKQSNLILWDVPSEIEIGVIPNKLYCNKIMIQPLSKVFKDLINKGCINELVTWDGCFNIRPIRGYEKQYKDLIKQNKPDQASKYLSIHSWACAVDVNAFENQLNTSGKLSSTFVKCFTDNGFDWGGSFKRKDPMHFQISSLNIF